MVHRKMTIYWSLSKHEKVYSCSLLLGMTCVPCFRLCHRRWVERLDWWHRHSLQELKVNQRSRASSKKRNTTPKVVLVAACSVQYWAMPLRKKGRMPRKVSTWLCCWATAVAFSVGYGQNNMLLRVRPLMLRSNAKKKIAILAKL